MVLQKQAEEWRTIHHSVLTMAIPSLDEIISTDPFILDRGMSFAQAAEFCGKDPEAMRSLHRRGQGPKFTQPDGTTRLVTTPRACIDWMTNERHGQIAAQRIKERAARSSRREVNA